MLVTSRTLARQMVLGGNVRAGIAAVYERMMGRPCDERKLVVLEGLYRKALEKYGKDENSIHAMAGHAGAKASDAAGVVVANAMLNLDEFITKN